MKEKMVLTHDIEPEEDLPSAYSVGAIPGR
jgi:hypothetical protein